MKKVILMILGFVITSCSSGGNVVCDLEKQVANAGAGGVMKLCTCTDQSQISAYILDKFNSLVPANTNICPAGGKLTSVIGSALCSPIINSLAAAGCSKIPSCTGTNPDSTVIQSAIDYCTSHI